MSLISINDVFSKPISDCQSEIPIDQNTSEGTPELELEYCSNHYKSVLQYANKWKATELKRQEYVPRYQKNTYSIERKN